MIFLFEVGDFMASKIITAVNSKLNQSLGPLEAQNRFLTTLKLKVVSNIEEVNEVVFK